MHALQQQADGYDDPLITWLNHSGDNAHRTLERIQRFADFVTSMLRFSFVIEPGRPRTDLRQFLVEFEILENFFDSVELDRDESAAAAFDANYEQKARDKRKKKFYFMSVKTDISGFRRRLR